MSIHLTLYLFVIQWMDSRVSTTYHFIPKLRPVIPGPRVRQSVVRFEGTKSLTSRVVLVDPW